MLLRFIPATFLIFFYVTALAEDKHLDVDGVKIHFTVEGEGEPVVLVHGFGANADFNWRWPGITAVLAKKYRVIAIDVRGHGQSGKPHEREAYGVEMVKDVVRVLDELKIDKAHIVGYSMGGFIAMKLVAEYPERVLSATLGGSGGIRDDFSYTLCDTVAKKLEAGESFHDALLSALPDDLKVEEEKLAMLQDLFRNQDTKALAAVLWCWRDLCVSYEKLEANKVPMLVIYGSREDADTQIYIASLEGRMSNSRFQVIDGVDHFTTIYSPTFRDLILKFLEANSGQ